MRNRFLRAAVITAGMAGAAAGCVDAPTASSSRVASAGIAPLLAAAHSAAGAAIPLNVSFAARQPRGADERPGRGFRDENRPCGPWMPGQGRDGAAAAAKARHRACRGRSRGSRQGGGSQAGRADWRTPDNRYPTLLSE